MIASQAGIQFLTKLHEAFIVLSLSQVLLRRICYHLIEEGHTDSTISDGAFSQPVEGYDVWYNYTKPLTEDEYEAPGR